MTTLELRKANSPSHQAHGEDMFENELRIHDHIADLRAEAAAERLAHSLEPAGRLVGVRRARVALGHALIAAGRLLAPAGLEERQAATGVRHPA
jgi:hypothetical protein